MQKKRVKLYQGDNIESLKKLPDNSVDSVVSDPPYALNFMGARWDSQVPSVEFWKEVYRVLKPGGHVLSFGGTRTYHRMTVNIEDAGFEIRDQIQWIYAQGFPKSLNINKAISEIDPSNKDFDGFGTNLKPANEPICVARKPLSEKSVAENVLKWGTGGINIDGTRITSYNPSDKTSDNTYNTIPSHILSELQDTLYKAEPFSLVVENHQDLFPSDVSCVQNWLKLPSCLDDYSTYSHLYDGLLPLFQVGDQVSVQQLHDALSYISHYEGQNGIPLGPNNHLYISSLSKIILMFIDRVSEKVVSEGRFPANIILECLCDEVIKGEKGEVKKSGYRVGGKSENSVGLNGVKNAPDNYGDKGDIHTNPMCPCYMLDEQSGLINQGHWPKGSTKGFGEFGGGSSSYEGVGKKDKTKSGASRFFYQAKVSKAERNMGLDGFEDKKVAFRATKGGSSGEASKGMERFESIKKNNHPTVKPVALMAYLCRLVTPPNGIVLDPFMGSGSTGIAAQLEGFRFCGMELDEDYFKIAEARINDFEKYRKFHDPNKGLKNGNTRMASRSENSNSIGLGICKK